MNIFNIKKDIGKTKETWNQIKEKAPLFSSVIKSIFVIIKWVVIVLIIIFVVLIIVQIIGFLVTGDWNWSV